MTGYAPTQIAAALTKQDHKCAGCGEQLAYKDAIILDGARHREARSLESKCRTGLPKLLALRDPRWVRARQQHLANVEKLRLKGSGNPDSAGRSEHRSLV